MKINILGSEWEIIETTDSEHPELENSDGWCGTYVRKILVESNLFADSPKTDLSEQAKPIRKKDLLRHEIIHAFVRESGAQHSILDNEFCVHWIALMFPKMLKLFEETGAL